MLHFMQYLGALLHVLYVHDTNCMTTCFIGNVGERNLANCSDLPKFFAVRYSIVLKYLNMSICRMVEYSFEP